MKVPLANSAPPGDSPLCSPRSYNLLSRQRATSHSFLEPSMRSKLSDGPSDMGLRRTSRLPSQQHDPDSWLVSNGQERVALRIRCVYCGAILGCVLGLALMVGAGLSFAIYLGCLSIEQQRAVWLRKLRAPPGSEIRLASLQRAIREQEQRQAEQQEVIRLQLKFGIILAGIGLFMLVFGIVCCCIHPATSERRRRTCCDCFPRPQSLKLTGSTSNASSPRTRKSTPISSGRHERSVSTCAASPQHLSVIRGVTDDDNPAPRSFLRRFSFL